MIFISRDFHIFQSVCDMRHNFRWFFSNAHLFFSAFDFASCTLREKLKVTTILLSVAFSVSTRSRLNYKIASMADKAVLDAFNRFDTDGSGSISREELGEAREKRNFHVLSDVKEKCQPTKMGTIF